VQVDPVAPFDLTRYDFIRVQPPSSLRPELAGNKQLGAGEMEAIALAIELHADVILMDERPGRALANRLGLHATGVLSLLVDAKSRGLVPLVAPLLDQLRDTIDFRMSDVLRSRILADAGEV
jgi:uncharacterized protein